MPFEHNSQTGFGIYVNDGNAPSADSVERNKQFGDWHHVVGVFDRDGNVELFVDGVSIGLEAVQEADISNDVPLFIARRATGEWFQGTLDELRIYKRALSAAEVQQNFAAQGLPPQSDVISVAPLGKLAITWGRIKASR